MGFPIKAQTLPAVSGCKFYYGRFRRIRQRSKELEDRLFTVAPKRNLWKGTIRIDPEGIECRIGALWTLLFLKSGWALTAFRKVWMKNERTWQRYSQDVWWRAHEHHHIIQLDTYFRGNNFRYLMAFVWQYVRYRSHDRAPLELDADRAADEYVRSQTDQSTVSKRELDDIGIP